MTPHEKARELFNAMERLYLASIGEVKILPGGEREYSPFDAETYRKASVGLIALAIKEERKESADIARTYGKTWKAQEPTAPFDAIAEAIEDRK